MTTLPSSELDALFADAAPGWASRYETRPSLIARLATVGPALRTELEARGGGTDAPPRVLDFGSGGGVFAAVASDLSSSVVCLDRSEAMLRSARENRGTLQRLAHGLGGEYRPDRIQPVIGDDGSLRGLRDESFDAILAIAVLEYVPSPAETLGELLRCLTPDGVLLAVVPNPRSLLRRIEPPINTVSAWFGSRIRSARLADRACTGRAHQTRMDILACVPASGGTVDSVETIPLALGGPRRHVAPNRLVRIRRMKRN
jgi:SAM-dependent methyltransferase